ncbi:MAG: iron ABC transporter permease [Chromatiales bacterium]|nr:iron ABC transporter permease [Chromatiales bacterium]
MFLISQRLLTLLIVLPIATLFISFIAPDTDVWQHLLETQLFNYIGNSLLLCVGVAIVSLVIGTTTACLCVMFRFPGRRFLAWAMVLPLAFPPYIVAYTYTGILDYGGWFNNWWHLSLGFPVLPIRSLSGAILVLSFVLYPYVYLLVYMILISQSSNLIDVARLAGLRAKQIFFRLILPLVRPAAIAGVALVVMESLANYATVEYFGVQTLSVGIFKVWLGLGSLTAAAQLSLIILVFTVLVVSIEKAARKRISYYNQGCHPPLQAIYTLTGAKTVVAWLICGLPITLGFAIPLLQLSAWTYRYGTEKFDSEYLQLMLNSLSLGFATALIVVFIAVIMAYGQRLHPSSKWLWVDKLATSGYAVPGVVIAIGVLIVITTVEGFVNKASTALDFSAVGLFLSGTVVALLFAYTVRFMTLGYNTIASSLTKVSPNIDYAASSCGASKLQTLRLIHIPLIRSGLFSAALLIFADVVKELPATLVLRPFEFNTLAVRTYELASTERINDIAVPSLSIVAISLISIVLVAQRITPFRK